MSYIDFGQSYGSATRGASTRAVGEEGGEYTTAANNENGYGDITTLAVGEEGGGIVSTKALFEEGGGADANASKDTYDYINFIRSADYYNGNYDGQISKQEVTAQNNDYKDRIKQIDRYTQYFPSATSYYADMRERLSSKLAVGTRILNNFDVFAKGGFSVYKGDNAKTIVEDDVWSLAYRDNNPYDISNRDLRPPIYYLRGETAATE
jgi:hypothetical protein